MKSKHGDGCIAREVDIVLQSGGRSKIDMVTFATKRLRLGLACACLLIPFLPRALQPADANGDTRSLRIRNTHNSESIDLVFKRDGRYDQEALKKFNWFLRDWRTNEPTEMDPRLLDLVWEVYRDLGASEPMQLVSGFRSRQTNNFLRSRSSGVAKESQHTRGKAMDFFVPGVALARIRERGILRQRGGVGFYPSSGSPFVHLDVGNVRAWPRMTRDQLVRLFPDGNTLHLPADGRPLAGYETTLAKLGRDGKRGETVLAYAKDGEQPVDEGRRKPASSVLASLFGANSEDEDEGEKPIVRKNQQAVIASVVPTRSKPADVAPATLSLTTREEHLPLKVTAAAQPLSATANPAPQPLPRPIVTAALQAETSPRLPETIAAIPRPLARPSAPGSSAIVSAPAPENSDRLARLAPAQTPVVVSPPVSGLITHGEQVAALAPLAARLREQVEKAEFAKLDYRRLDQRSLTPAPMVVDAIFTPPSIGNLVHAMGPAMLATQFGRRAVPHLFAFAGQAVRFKRPNTI